MTRTSGSSDEVIQLQVVNNSVLVVEAHKVNVDIPILVLLNSKHDHFQLKNKKLNSKQFTVITPQNRKFYKMLSGTGSKIEANAIMNSNIV